MYCHRFARLKAFLQLLDHGISDGRNPVPESHQRTESGTVLKIVEAFLKHTTHEYVAGEKGFHHP